jgi:hypothetical protein
VSADRMKKIPTLPALLLALLLGGGVLRADIFDLTNEYSFPVQSLWSVATCA